MDISPIGIRPSTTRPKPLPSDRVGEAIVQETQAFQDTVAISITVHKHYSAKSSPPPVPKAEEWFAAGKSMMIRNTDREYSMRRTLIKEGIFVEVSEATVTRSRSHQDPLVLDLGGDGFSTTGLNGGPTFDLDGDGQKEKTSFVSGNDFLLALDHNGNGHIDSGRELFGNQNGARDGIQELARYDLNQDGVINTLDPVFRKLQLFQSENHKPLSLSEAGVEQIHLRRIHTTGVHANQDYWDGELKVQMQDGSQRQIRDYWFLTSAVS